MKSLQKSIDTGINWKEGVTDFDLNSVYVENIELKILQGQAYLIDSSKNTYHELTDQSYTDFMQYENLIILSTYTKIDIYHLMDFKIEFEIDDIDGIKLNKVKSGILFGKFNQIEDRGGVHWKDFRINLSSLEFSCDHGRMWTETKMKYGNEETKYMTMDIKK